MADTNSQFNSIWGVPNTPAKAPTPAPTNINTQFDNIWGTKTPPKGSPNTSRYDEILKLASTPEQASPDTNTLEGIKQSPVGQFAKNYWNVVSNSKQDFQNALTKPTANPVKQPLGFGVQAGSKLLSGTGAAWQDIWAPLSAGVETAIPQGSLGGGGMEAMTKGAASGAPFGPVGALLGAWLGIGEHLASKTDYFQKNPEVLKNMNNAMLTFGPMLQGIMPQEGAGAAGQPADLLNTPIQEYPGKLAQSYGLGNPGFNGEQASGVFKVNEMPDLLKGPKEALGGKMVQNEVSDWTKPSTQSKAAYNKATDIFKTAQENDHNIAETLVKNGIKMSDNTQNGVFSTSDSADSIRADAGQMSKDVLRPALEAANPSVERVPVEDVVDIARNNITNNKFIPEETKAGLIIDLDRAQTALENKYTSGMQLTDLLDEKIVRDINSKYNPLGDIASNNKATMNKALADAARNSLEANAPEGIPVQEFNGELAKQYQAADYLDALNNKKVPKGIISQIGKTTAKVMGATIGAKLGGGILGGVGGYHLGGMLESMFENMPNPVREFYLNNLQESNPEVFSQVQNYLSQQGLDQASRLQLNQGDSSKIPIELGPRGPQDIKGRPVNENTETSQNANFSSVGSQESQIAQNYLKSQVANIGQSHNATASEVIQFQKVFDNTDFSTATTPEEVIQTYVNNLPDNLKVGRTDFFNTMIEALNKNMDAYKKAGPRPADFNQGEIPTTIGEIAGTAGEALPKEPIFKGFKDLSTKLVEDLKGRDMVSKQYIQQRIISSDLNLKQVEKDMANQILDTYKTDKIPVKDFADKMKSELLPLKVKGSDIYEPSKTGFHSGEYMITEGNFTPKYENIALPSELRGKVEGYKENIYESPIKTSAGDSHFDYTSKNYFGHTRIEDMAKGDVRRVIEVQSDLYQKGNLEKESLGYKNVDEYNKDYPDQNFGKADRQKIQDAQKLQQYNDPTAHFRMVREEVKQAAVDGKKYLQFPTGETAMKIEGLGQGDHWYHVDTKTMSSSSSLAPSQLEVGKTVANSNGDFWIITDVLEDGKFKAVPKETADKFAKGKIPKSLYETGQESFDISGKIDTNNPIYRFYEKDLGRYLKTNYNADLIKDPQGVQWYQIKITPDMKKGPVKAFGKTKGKDYA